MDTSGINPPIVKVEQRADGDREIQCVIGPARRAHGLEIDVGDRRRVVIHLVNESKQRLVTVVERRRFDVLQNAVDERRITQQFRRNCGVGLQSKRAMIALRGVGGDQFADSWTDRSRATKDLLGKPRQMFGRSRQKREEVPDLWILRALCSHLLDQCAVRTRLRVVLDTRQEHRLHTRMIVGHSNAEC